MFPFASHFVITNVPAIILLKYTISHCITEAIDKSIETRFGGIGLPTAIKDLKEVITNGSNMIAMEINFRLFRLRAVSNRSVSRCPVLVVSNCTVHLLFNLTHGWFVWVELLITILGHFEGPTIMNFPDSVRVTQDNNLSVQ